MADLVLVFEPGDKDVEQPSSPSSPPSPAGDKNKFMRTTAARGEAKSARKTVQQQQLAVALKKLTAAGIRIVMAKSPCGLRRYALLTAVDQERLESEAELRKVSLQLQSRWRIPDAAVS